jgi:predicted DCC family thiol-disulfide oxidoreductase YuxK
VSNVTPPILLYDGTCGFCARSVQFLLRHERARRTLRFATLQGSIGAEVMRARPELAGFDSLVWYDAPRVLVRSDAVLAAADYLGGAWRLLGDVARVIPRALRDAAYDLVARHRYRIAGRACLVPTPAERARFLDAEAWGAGAPR